MSMIKKVVTKIRTYPLRVRALISIPILLIVPFVAFFEYTYKLKDPIIDLGLGIFDIFWQTILAIVIVFVSFSYVMITNKPYDRRNVPKWFPVGK